MSLKPLPPASPPAANERPSDTPPARIDSAQLFGGAQEVHILHLGSVYRLKQTALRKLILTK